MHATLARFSPASTTSYSARNTASRCWWVRLPNAYKPCCPAKPLHSRPRYIRWTSCRIMCTCLLRVIPAWPLLNLRHNSMAIPRASCGNISASAYPIALAVEQKLLYWQHRARLGSDRAALHRTPEGTGVTSDAKTHGLEISRDNGSSSSMLVRVALSGQDTVDHARRYLAGVPRLNYYEPGHGRRNTAGSKTPMRKACNSALSIWSVRIRTSLRVGLLPRSTARSSWLIASAIPRASKWMAARSTCPR